MTKPVDVAIAMWITQPFVLAALLFTLRACFLNLTLHRVVLVISCVLALSANGVLIAIFGGYEGIDNSVVGQFGVTTYNLGLWSCRAYVCMRMEKLSPSPAMSTAFNRLAYASGAFFMMTEVTYIISCVEFYRTHPSTESATANETAVACVFVADLVYEITSIVLHVKSLKMFATANLTGIKLLVLSCSTLSAIVFGLGNTISKMTGDKMTGLLMAGLQLAVLPSSLVLGEVVAIHIGRLLGKSMAIDRSSKGKLDTKSSKSQDKSQTQKTITAKRTSEVSKATPMSSTINEDQIRQPAAISQPSI